MGDYHRRTIEEAALARWGDIPCFEDLNRRERMRPMPIGSAQKPPTARERELMEALERTRAALRLLQPALNIMARECLDDIISREIDAILSHPQPSNLHKTQNAPAHLLTPESDNAGI